MDIKKVFTWKRIVAAIAVVVALVAMGYRLWGSEEDAKKVEAVGAEIEKGADKLKNADTPSDAGSKDAE